MDTRAPYLRLVTPADRSVQGLVRPGDEESWFPVYALGDYTGEARRIIVSWKHTVNRGLTTALQEIIRSVCISPGDARPIREGVDFLEPENANLVGEPLDVPSQPHLGCEPHDTKTVPDELSGTWNQRGVLCEPLNIVPAPSRGRKHKGLFVAGHIAEAVAEGLGADVDDVLRVHRRASTGKLQARRAKSRGIYAVRAPRSAQVILIDDVLTTGATLAGCARAIEARGGEVVAAVVLAAAPDPRAPSRETSRAPSHLL